MKRFPLITLATGLLALTLPAPSLAAPSGVPLTDLTTLEATLSAWEVQTIDNLTPDADGTITPFIELNGTEEVLLLTPHSLRSDHFQLLVQKPSGELVPQEAPPVSTYRGTIAGRPGSRVAASLIDGHLTARVSLSHDQVWMVEPLSDYDARAESEEYVVYPGQAVLPSDRGCGNDQLDPRRNRGIYTHPHAATAAACAGAGEAAQLSGDHPRLNGDLTNKMVEIACDTDYEFFQKNGNSVANTVADIENVLNGVDDIYQNDVEICYNITHLIIRTSSNDPYTSNDAETLLGQFEDHWRAEQNDVHRDVAHLFTGRNINGGTIGIAYISSICKSSTGYSLVESRYTNNYASRVSLSAHELGHNWSADHCCGGCWGCGGCRIMCPCNGGCSGIITSFGTDAIASITQHRSTRGCLDDGCGAALDLVEPVPGTAGSSNTLTLRGATPNGEVGFFYSLQLGNWEALPYCPGVFMGLSTPTLLGVATANSNGIATLAASVPGNARNATVHFQAGDASSCNLSDIVSYTFE
jgi:hypothetical protein